MRDFPPGEIKCADGLTPIMGAQPSVQGAESKLKAIQDCCVDGLEQRRSVRLSDRSEKNPTTALARLWRRLMFRLLTCGESNMKTKTRKTVEQPAPFTPGITKGMVRQHAYELFR